MLDYCPRTPLLHQGSPWTVIAFPRDGNNKSPTACAQALLLPGHGQRHGQPWEFAQLSSPSPDFPQPLCQAKAVPCLLPFRPILLSLPHFHIWELVLAAGRMGWLLNASSLPLRKCFTIGTNTP